jgi:hypothetical protein
MPNDLTEFMDDFSTWAKARLDVYIAASKVTANKVIDGTYSGDEMNADLNAAWQRMSEDVTSLLKILPVDLSSTKNP